MGKINEYDPKIFRGLVCEFHKLATEIICILTPEESAPEEPKPKEPEPEENYDDVVSKILENIDKNTLIGQIMAHMKEKGSMNKSSYEKLEYVQNWIPKSSHEKKVTPFSTAKHHLNYNGGKQHPWLKMDQQKYGPIIYNMGDYMVLSDKWKEIISKM